MRYLTLIISSLAGAFWIAPAQAQLVLPGAAAPTPAGAAPSAAGGAKKPAKKPAKRSGGGAPESGGVATTRAPGEDSVAGRQFQRNGSTGVIALERSGGKTLEVSKLILIGYQIAKPAELCRVEVGGGNINLKPSERHEGLISYQVEMEACPFSLDVLEGAVRVRGKTCEFRAADCNADPSGVWGPPGAGIGEAEGKAIEKVRGKADKDARAGFRAVLARAHGDKVRVREVAREQASFSSVREEMCRDYAREDKHGFCASRITLARAVALSAQLNPVATAGANDPEKPPPPRKKPKPKPKPSAMAAPAQSFPGLQ